MINDKSEMINYKQKESKIICEENQISSKKEKQNNKTEIRGSVSGRENVSAVLGLERFLLVKIRKITEEKKDIIDEETS